MAGEFTIQRSTTIQAPASAIYPHLADFRRWQAWSPWEGLDPNLERTYSDPSSGVGAGYGWKGNRKAGEGRMAFTDQVEPTRVALDLTFLKPWKATNQVAFTLTESDGATTVVWTMSGTHSGMMRFFGKIVNLDKLVGKDFEKGLAALKAESEAGVTAA